MNAIQPCLFTTVLNYVSILKEAIPVIACLGTDWGQIDSPVKVTIKYFPSLDLTGIAYSFGLVFGGVCQLTITLVQKDQWIKRRYVFVLSSCQTSR